MLFILQTGTKKTVCQRLCFIKSQSILSSYHSNKENLFLYLSMRKKKPILTALIFLLTIAAQAQNTGINTKDPTAKLDVNGDARVRSLPTGQTTDLVVTTDALGNLRTMAALIWDPKAPRISEPYLDAAGGTDLVFSNNGWNDNTFTDLLLTSVSDPDKVYDASTGIATIKTDGFYQIHGQVRLSNNHGNTIFDGTSAQLNGVLLVKPKGKTIYTRVDKRANVILAGVKETIGGTGIASLAYDLNMSATLYLVAGDQVKLQFSTVSTSSMNTDKKLIIIARDGCYLRLYRF
jgi:hypothetical protein